MGVALSDLTGTERAVLLVLMAESRPVTNPELAVLGPRLEKPGRDKLNGLGLVESTRTGTRYSHELTDRGWHVCREILAGGPPPRSAGAAKAFYTVLGALDRYLAGADLSLADVFGAVTPSEPPDEPATVENRIRQAYRDLTPRPGAWVKLSRLRAELTDAPRADVDAALHDMYRSPGVSLIPEENQKVLTAEDRAAAIVIGDQNKHLMAIEL